MFMCPGDWCLFQSADWNVWAEHVRVCLGKIPCSVAGCMHVFKEKRCCQRHFVRDHTEAGRYRCSACATVYKARDYAVKHCKKCTKGGKPVPVDAVEEGDDAVEEAVDEAAVGGDAVEVAAVEATVSDAVKVAAVGDTVPIEVESSDVEKEVAAALSFYRAPLVVPLSPLRDVAVDFVPPIVRVDVHLLVAGTC